MKGPTGIGVRLFTEFVLARQGVSAPTAGPAPPRLAVLLLLAVTALEAQSTGQPSADSLRNAQDTVDLSARYLEGEALAKIQLPVAPRLDPDGVMPTGSRIVYDPRLIEWATAPVRR